MSRTFLKMNGLGNDFVVIETATQSFDPTPEEIRAIAKRGEGGVGCDQVIAIDPPRAAGASAYVRFWNSDGEETGACGNGTRCVAWLLMQSAGKDAVAFDTVAGLVNALAGHVPQRHEKIAHPGGFALEVLAADPRRVKRVRVRRVAAEAEV